MQTYTISDLQKISLRDLSRYGLLPDPSRAEKVGGRITLRRSNFLGEIESIEIPVESFSDGKGGGYLSFWGEKSGLPYRYTYPLRRVSSNLPSGGYYFALSLGSGRRGYNLYLYDDLLTAREDLPDKMEYETQTRSNYWKGLYRDGVVVDILSIFAKGRKVHYRGSLTPYGRKISHRFNQISNWRDTISSDPVVESILSRWEENISEEEVSRLKVYPRYRTKLGKLLSL